MDISKELSLFFKGNGITQEQIAVALGVTQPYVSALLTGKRELGKKQAKRFEELYGLSSAWLLTGEGEMLKQKYQAEHIDGGNAQGERAMNHSNDSEILKSFLAEIAAQRQLTENSQHLLAEQQQQNALMLQNLTQLINQITHK